MPRHQSNNLTLPQQHTPQQNARALVLPTPPTRPLPRNRPSATTTKPKINPHSTNSPTTSKNTKKIDIPHSPIREMPWTTDPSLQQLGQHTLPHAPLTILELYGGTATGLEVLLKAGRSIKTYAWADTDPDAYTSLQHRITQMREKYPCQLPPRPPPIGITFSHLTSPTPHQQTDKQTFPQV